MAQTKPTDLKLLLANSQLPALPQSAIKLLELSQNEKNGPEEFAKPLESDPGLSGQILKFVNSSYFGFAREISSIKMAFTLVGVRTIKNFALWNAVFSLIPNPKCGPFDLKNLWVDSLRRGLFARGFGKMQKLKEADDFFTIALLQDLAIPLLAKALPDAYVTLLSKRETSRQRLSVLEQAEFGWDHATAAGVVARMWSLPEHIASALEKHTSLTQLASEAKPNLTHAVVALSSALPAAKDVEWFDREDFEEKYKQFAEGKPKSTCLELLQQVDQEYQEVAPLLQLPIPSKKLVDFFPATAKTK